MSQGKRREVRENPIQAALRWERQRQVAQLYGEQVAEDGTILQTEREGLVLFGHRVMELLGFELDPLQEDILLFMYEEHRSSMVQAQRSQAKSTLAAIIAAWDLIQHPYHRNAVVMPKEDLATQVISMMIKIFETLPELSETFLPDPRAGDRTGVQGWDIHHSLKGVDKSPSLAPISLMGTLQSRRVDLAIIDEAETEKNSRTAEAREDILKRVRDFESICMGRLLWLGTPQSMQSIYFDLVDRGTVVRIWPGRFPTDKEIPFYRGCLAPWITDQIKADPSLQSGGGVDGSQGKPTCPSYLGEQVLQQKELAMGPAWYQLQHMLNATLTDEGKKALRTKDVIVVTQDKEFPVRVDKGMGPSFVHQHLSMGRKYDLALPSAFSEERKAPVIRAYVDPAAGGSVSGDRTAFSVVGLVAGNIVLLSYGSFPGGYDKEGLYKLAEALCPHRPVSITIEKNMGYGAFKEVFQPIMLEVAEKHGFKPGIEDDLAKGQKEVRIIEVLTPVFARGSMWVTDKALDEEVRYLEGIPPGKAGSYSLWHQIANITRERGSLYKDDLLDSLAGAVNLFREELALDAAKMAQAIQKNAHKQMTKEMRDFLSGKTR